jgi:bifunctional DNA-binding transcriptional regulator/antitoxin component of YhaV-PrlF toxin-antitoxin module
LPVSENTWIHAKLLSENRVQIPVLVRWKFKLEPGEVLKVKVSPMRSHASETFFVRLQKGGRITVPTQVAVFLELESGDVLEVGLLAEKPAEK